MSYTICCLQNEHYFRFCNKYLGIVCFVCLLVCLCLFIQHGYLCSDICISAGCAALILYLTVNQAVTSHYDHPNHTVVVALCINSTLNNQKAIYRNHVIS